MTLPIETPPESVSRPAADDSRTWLGRLRGSGPERDAAVAELHRLLLKAARFEVSRRTEGLAHFRGGDREDLALQSADDALVSVLRKLDDFRGESRFTTWDDALNDYNGGGVADYRGDIERRMAKVA